MANTRRSGARRGAAVDPAAVVAAVAAALPGLLEGLEEADGAPDHHHHLERLNPRRLTPSLSPALTGMAPRLGHLHPNPNLRLIRRLTLHLVLPRTRLGSSPKLPVSVLGRFLGRVKARGG